jgi:hypothetical protein
MQSNALRFFICSYNIFRYYILVVSAFYRTSVSCDVFYDDSLFSFFTCALTCSVIYIGFRAICNHFLTRWFAER